MGEGNYCPTCGADEPNWNAARAFDTKDRLRPYLDPEYADKMTVEHLAWLLEKRDQFIVRSGLWDVFAKSLES